MAAKIKLRRIGAKKRPLYRFVVLDESAPTKAVALDTLGTYNPRQEPTLIEFDKEKVEAWLKKGAEPTEKVRILLGKAGILPLVSFEGKPKRKPRKEAAKEEGAEGAAKPAEGAAPKKEEAPKEEKKVEAPKEEPKPEVQKEEPKTEEKAS
ncbi:MAG: 30S ribosomal protein S16 [Candidatus Margulisbacteria bacterium]|nr:30S ribosomal protein S16 [Candidatus Margulisiibacteriota bacterium]MBU1021748.1 30S ribosomal protein S16 [Candidatus Margulisiibacteriota bacterium]MBU1729494.1 30S ribosomal protein S16 [Candidatus Margulisiibacteriota bacterium]MBU1955405.1 30S ribosomal protein S16 [Candidatus Margulisiibacteriota bacterium]